MIWPPWYVMTYIAILVIIPDLDDIDTVCADSAAAARLGEAHQYGPGCCQGNAVLAYVPAPHTAQGSQVCQFARQQALESEGTLACYCGALPGLNLAVRFLCWWQP